MVTAESDTDRSQIRNVVLDTQKLPKYNAALVSAAQAILQQGGRHELVSRCSKIAERYIELLDIFQQDPQLLDQHLKTVLPALDKLYIDFVVSEQFIKGEADTRSAARCVADVLYQWCKVRGDRVISSFLSNEPRLLQPMLRACELISNEPDQQIGKDTSWRHQYVLYVWISNLLLVPFDLATLSEPMSTLCLSEVGLIELPSRLPETAVQSIRFAVRSISLPSKVQKPAGVMMTTLALRPDMQKLNLLFVFVQWALTSIRASSNNFDDLHRNIGMLSLISAIVKQGRINEIVAHVRNVHATIMDLFEPESGALTVLAGSSVARRLAIKIERNILLHLLRSQRRVESTAHAITHQLLEHESLDEIIVDFLLLTLSDRETRTRTAAAKALSLITTTLRSDLANDVVEAVIAALDEDVLVQDQVRDFSAVSSPKWHGLVMTLSLMLFHRSPTLPLLGKILRALFCALQFEQRAATGAFLGTGIRDAANIGLWSLVRRYSTKELRSLVLPLGSSSPSSGLADSSSDLSILQATAANLVVTACLDPIGNVRRGSSAAFQELVGRHPDIVANGIALVQILDYQAVSLRQRAMTEVALEVCRTSRQYTNGFITELQGWRGFRSTDAQTRRLAASTISKLVSSVGLEAITALIKQCFELIRIGEISGKEDTHGALLTIASCVSSEKLGEHVAASNLDVFEEVVGVTLSCHDMMVDQRRQTMEPEGSLKLTLALMTILKRCKESSAVDDEYCHMQASRFRELMYACIRGSTEAMLGDVACCMSLFAKLADFALIRKTLDVISKELSLATSITRSRGALTSCGIIISETAGSEFTVEIDDAFDIMCRKADPSNDMDVRVMAFRCLSTTIEEPLTSIGPARRVVQLIREGLDDYTISERGDVGSLLRAEAISSFRRVVERGYIAALPDEVAACYLAIRRLALEKLDAIRQCAHACLSGAHTEDHDAEDVVEDTSDISHVKYFQAHLCCLVGKPSAACRDYGISLLDEQMAVLEGVAGTISGGHDKSATAARSALYEVLLRCPIAGYQENLETSLESVGSTLTALLAKQHGNDRRLIPLLDVVAFLLSVGMLQRLESSNFRWKQLLTIIQRSHYKAANVTKVSAAIQVYRGLLDIDALQASVVKKLCELLRHAFPRIRVEAAEILYYHTSDQRLLGRDWSAPIKANSSTLEILTKTYVQA